MNASSGQSIPRPPTERTFVFAVTLLAIAALIQIAAVVVALAPDVRFGRADSGVEMVEEVTVAEAPSPAAAAAEEADVNEQINLLIDEAEALRNAGQFEQSLRPLTEASRLRPDEPMIWFHIARTHRALGRDAQALPFLQRILADPKVKSPTVQEYEDLRQFTQAELVDMGVADPGPAAAPAAAASATQPSANAMRDEVGIPIGSVMGIVETRVEDGEPGMKKLRIATKASPTVNVDDPLNVQTMVYFFEQNDHGDVMQTQSPVSPEWLSPPVDWKNGEPELLEVIYPLPQEQGDVPALQYYGYIVGVYFKGELQDFRSEPASLAEQFPLKFNMTDEVQ